MNIDLFTENDIKRLVEKCQALEYENIRLKKCIESFKKYDSERREHYKDIDIKYGQLESYCDELEYQINSDVSKKELKRLNESVVKYKNLYQTEVDKNKVLTKPANMAELMQLEFYKSYYEKHKIKETNREIRLAEKSKEIKRLHNTISNLIYRLNHEINQTVLGDSGAETGS